MIYRVFVGTVSAIALMTGAVFAKKTVIENIDVKFELSAVSSPAAAEFWTSLETDLEKAIAVNGAELIGKNGAKIHIDIDELAVSDSFETALERTSVIAGHVQVKDKRDATVNSYFDLKVSLKDKTGLFIRKDGIEILTIPQEEAYAMIVDEFAASVIKNLR